MSEILTEDEIQEAADEFRRSIWYYLDARAPHTWAPATVNYKGRELGLVFPTTEKGGELWPLIGMIWELKMEVKELNARIGATNEI